MSVAAHSITAVYAGDTDFVASTSTALAQTVNAAGTTTTGSVSGTQYFGQALTFTATVTANSPSTATSIGSVDFFDTTTNDDLGTVSLSGGKATLSTTALPLGGQIITLSYLGNTGFFASNTTVRVTIISSLFVLNSTASGALTLSGNASINLPGTVVVDSNATTALTASGNAKVTAGSILAVGGVSKSGNATLSPAASTGVASAPDPLASLSAPSAVGLMNYGSASNCSGTHSLNPGVFTKISASGNARLTLNPGAYIIEGGGLSVTGNAVVIGTGVMLYNTNSKYPGSGGSFGSITLSGNGTLNLIASTRGAYAGIVLFQDRSNTQTITLSENAFEQGSGNIVYAPAVLCP